MKKEIIRVEPLATYLERWKAPTSTVVKHGNILYVTGAPPYEPETGEIFGDSFVMAICLAIYLRKRLCDCSIPLTVTTRRLML